MNINKDEFTKFLCASGFYKENSKTYSEYWFYMREMMVYFDFYPSNKLIHNVEVHLNQGDLGSYNFDVDVTREFLSAFYDQGGSDNE